MPRHLHDCGTTIVIRLTEPEAPGRRPNACAARHTDHRVGDFLTL